MFQLTFLANNKWKTLASLAMWRENYENDANESLFFSVHDKIPKYYTVNVIESD